MRPIYAKDGSATLPSRTRSVTRKSGGDTIHGGNVGGVDLPSRPALRTIFAGVAQKAPALAAKPVTTKVTPVNHKAQLVTNTREQPIFTTCAHVFQIDPVSKKKWLPISTLAIDVSYYYDNSRNTYRIISVDGSKVVINSTITSNMVFTKTSQKFGQWTDSQGNGTVYGLGFSSESDLTKFVDKFKEVKQLSASSQDTTVSNAKTVSIQNEKNSNSNSNINGSPANKHLNGVSDSPTNSTKSILKTESSNSINSDQRNSTDSQLKYENDRLKIALAQSSSNAKKWEVELQTLKNNNARLTTALQESTSNVEEWKRQLASYKDEAAHLKIRNAELESGTHTISPEHQSKLHEMERLNQSQQDEILELKKKLELAKTSESQHLKNQEKIQSMQRDNEDLRNQLSEAKRQADASKLSVVRDRQRMKQLQDEIASKLSGLSLLQQEVNSCLQSTP